MSVIISMMRVPEGIVSLADFPPNFVQEPLGSHADVMALIRALFPDADYSDPTWIGVYSDRLSEVIMGVEDPVYGLGFRNPSFELIQEVFSAVGWRGIDPSNGRITLPFIPPEYYGFRASGS
jgi:hypothetical protein